MTNYDEILKNEIRKIPDYPNYYIDRSGNVFDKNYRYIKPYHYNDHYDQICIYDKNGKHKMLAIHQAVAMTFKPDEYFKGCIVHHKDENKYNNHIDNLEILDRSSHASIHARIYYDKIAICQICGKKFLWTAERQMHYYGDKRINRKRLITCSRSCSSYAGRMTQLKRIIKYKSKCNSKE